MPVDGFFEWRAIEGAPTRQPYAIAMKDGSPFGLAGLWENWRNPNTGEWERAFAISPCPLTTWSLRYTTACPRYLSLRAINAGFRTPRDLLITYPLEPLKMWLISRRVRAAENDDPSPPDRAEEVNGH